jgi:TPR repeat protein
LLTFFKRKKIVYDRSQQKIRIRRRNILSGQTMKSIATIKRIATMKSIRSIMSLAPIATLAACAGSHQNASANSAKNPRPTAVATTAPSVANFDEDLAHAREMGRRCQLGIGLPVDYQLAMLWYQRAVAAGDWRAMSDIAFLYEYGLGVHQDFSAATAWYRTAASAGDLLAMNEIGCLYATGRGVSQDYALAMFWWKKAADKGDASSMYKIGAMYELGVVADEVWPQMPGDALFHPDMKEAINWYTRAAALGDVSAKKHLLEMQVD